MADAPAPMGPPPARPQVARLRRPAAQLQRARDAPPRPELYDCDVCKHCKGGECARWRQMQREWVETWQGRPPPAEGSWANWWKAAKTHHALLLTAAEAAAAQMVPSAATGKRHAQPDGTPNMGGARKKCATTQGWWGGQQQSSFFSPPTHAGAADC